MFIAKEKYGQNLMVNYIGRKIIKKKKKKDRNQT